MVAYVTVPFVIRQLTLRWPSLPYVFFFYSILHYDALCYGTQVIVTRVTLRYSLFSRTIFPHILSC